MRALAAAIFHALAHAYWQVILGGTVCLVLEQLWGRDRCSMTGRLRAALFWTVNGAVVVACATVFTLIMARLKIEPLLSIDLDAFGHGSNRVLQIATWVLAPVIAAGIGDFFAYWLHRATHAVPVLWRVHRLHHSIRDLNGWNSVTHIGDGLLQIPFVALPLAALIHPHVGYAPAVVMVVLGLHGFYHHANTRVSLGPLRRLVSDNRFHRIHHSLEAEHQNRNFGNFTTVWDQLFGTAYFPASGEWPAVGLPEHEQPRTLRDYLLMPFRP